VLSLFVIKFLDNANHYQCKQINNATSCKRAGLLVGGDLKTSTTAQLH